MKRLAWILLPLLLLVFSSARAQDSDPTRVLDGKAPNDSRLGKAKTLNDYFPLTPPANRESWETRRKDLREQVLVANGLWPMPPREPIKAVVHGSIDRDDYTIAKVYFASYPGHYVCGNLYMPKKRTGQVPGVLCPHGHWANGRFYDAGEKAAAGLVQQGGEKTIASARYHIQARCAGLARLGCVVFHYDMVGYADSQQIKHREGFTGAKTESGARDARTDAEAELRLQSFMGLQTYNSIRALDFLVSLPEVDRNRIGVTGASGGGTQTFILGAIDDRPTVAFPAVMVSTGMQGGCICENCSYLRLGTGNVELAGLFAPKPLGMSGANDWTKEIETKGLPELKQLYKLYDAEDKVMAKCFPEYGHNYNQVSREVMYSWFNKHLKLGLTEPITEKPFVPVPPRELEVFDDQHPMPKDAVDAARLRTTMTQISDRQITALLPKDANGLAEFQNVIGPALRVMINDRLPKTAEVEVKTGKSSETPDGVHLDRLMLGRKGQGEEIPAILVRGKEFDGTMVVWIHPAGKSSLMRGGKLAPAAQRIIDRKALILAPDVFLTGEFPADKATQVNAGYAGYTFGYNRPLLANRVHDILTTIAAMGSIKGVKTVHLVGFEKAGPWAVLARALAGDAVSRTAVDLDQFRFEKVGATSDEMMLPGALKYGGLAAFAALCAPGELLVHNHSGTGTGEWVRAAYNAAGKPDRLQRSEEKMAEDKVIEWLLR